MTILCIFIKPDSFLLSMSTEAFSIFPSYSFLSSGHLLPLLPFFYSARYVTKMCHLVPHPILYNNSFQ